MEGNKKTVKIKDKEYCLQNPGVRAYIKHQDECTDRFGNLVFEKYVDGLFEKVVIQPANLSMDDFDSVGAVEELVEEIESFLKA